MLKQPRFILLGSIATFLALCLALASASPIRISISVARDEPLAAAAPLAEITATAPPATPTATVPPTATAPPTATSAPTLTPQPTNPPASPIPTEPRRTFDQPTPAPTEVPPATPPPATPAPTPDVAIDKQVDRAVAGRGDTLVFTITARNLGQGGARDVVVTDVVPAALEVIDLASSKGAIVVEGQTVTAYPATLAPAEAVTIRVTARVRDAAAGQLRNMALITTSTPGDDPGNNTSTVTVRIDQPATPVKRSPPQAPARMPVTADPDAPTFLLVYGPWLGLGLMIVLFGAYTRFGLLRQRLVTVSFGAAPAQSARPAPAEGFELDPAELVRRWRAGTSVATLSSEAAARHPGANRLAISLAVQRLIDEQLGK